jgi:guanyl-specific ribonuclease Sa
MRRKAASARSPASGRVSGVLLGGGDAILPRLDSQGNPITYGEWGTIPAAGNLKPGRERIVTGSNGSIYYSSDHYSTFISWLP